MNVKPLKEILSKPMSRQEFLKLSGVAVLGIFGYQNFLQYFQRNNQPNNSTVAQSTHSNNGFGSRPFGS